MQVQIYKPKCPYCGWIRHIELNMEGDEVDVVKGLVEKVEAFVTNFKKREDTVCWMDLPPCPKCDRVYQYNPETGETRK